MVTSNPSGALTKRLVGLPLRMAMPRATLRRLHDAPAKQNTRFTISLVKAACAEVSGTGDQKVDLSCHSDDGKHVIALSNGDGTFLSKAWWPNVPGQGPAWCDPLHLKLGDYNNDQKVDLSCQPRSQPTSRGIPPCSTPRRSRPRLGNLPEPEFLTQKFT